MNKIYIFILLFSSMSFAQENLPEGAEVSTPSVLESPILIPPPPPAAVTSDILPKISAPITKPPMLLERAKKSIQTSKIIRTSDDDEASLSPESNLEYTKKIQNELEELKNLSADRFIQEIDHYRVDIDKYNEHKKRVCNGEFTTNVLGDEKAESRNSSKRKLNPAERKLCFREMKALQVTMINNMYTARKRFLEYMHEERMKELSLARDKVIEELQSTFAR